MKKIISIACFIFLTCTLSLAQNPILKRHMSFDNDWKFHLGNAADPARDFNYSIANIFSKTGNGGGSAVDMRFNDSSWRTLQLPHDWAVELPFANSSSFDVMAHGYKPVGGLFPETSIGWYRKHFSINKNDSGSHFQIQFDGVFRDANVWINGIYLGNNKSGYTGFNYDITDFIHFGKDNVIVVRADATQYEGWFYEGAGIYRHVWLNQYNNLHIGDHGAYVYCDIQKSNAVVNIETPLQNQNFTAEKCTVQSVITERNGKIAAQTNDEPLSLQSGETKIVHQKITLADPKLWSIDEPYLYRMVTIVRQNGKVIDEEEKRFGIRKVEATVNGLFINGKYVKVKGVCDHQDHAGVGSALPDYLQYYRIHLLKEMGANAYRTSHNPPTPELLDACDSLGMIVLDETRLLNSGSEYKDQFERLIIRDRTHPSVFMWSIGNEEGYIQTSTVGKRMAQTLIADQKELDPSRTCTYAADVGNVYQGVNEVIPVRGFNYRIKAVDAYHKDHPHQPIIGTEMGSTVTTRGIYIKDTVNCYVPDEDITAPWWANTAEDWWSLAATRPWWMGGFVWTGFDYRGEPTPYQWPNINSHFGVMDVCGFPKNIYYYYQSWWTDKDVLHIAPHWNWKGKEGQPIDVWVYSNADNVELFLNGKSLGKKDMPRNGHLQWSVNYEPGTLSAVGFKNGRKITAKVETTGEPAEVVVTPYKTTMIADGKDATVINITAVDKQGREVPDASNLISFSVTGDGKIIGVGNGDPSSHEPDKCEEGKWQRKLFNGKCQVILQAGTAASTIKFEATSPGLWKGGTDIITIAPESLKISSKVNPESLFKEPPIQPSGKILGADISFLPQLEARGLHFSDNGKEKDAIEILKDHGFNYIRLRLFVNPADSNGYSPKEGFCDLQHTLEMARRIKNAGMKFLLDFHYSDTWADPGKQYTPAAWKALGFTQLTQKIYSYTKEVLEKLKAQNTLPDMVQPGNEINHGILWPDGNIQHPDSLADLLKAAIKAIKEADPGIIVMLHIALGGQNSESEFFLDNMINRGVVFDAIGESYYPKWHGTLEDLQTNLTALEDKYHKPVIIAEYSQLKNEVNKIAFTLPHEKLKGTFIWEPLSTWEALFDKDGKSNERLRMFDTISTGFLTN
ncbi:MAG TPA: beta-galactosidase GalA [Chitinophagaceae bacterium]|nr:beta-galactosidase GalA [Chitinophagaceae bacterium]